MTKQKVNYQEYRVEQTCECADATATIITIPVPPGEYIGIRG